LKRATVGLLLSQSVHFCLALGFVREGFVVQKALEVVFGERLNVDIARQRRLFGKGTERGKSERRGSRRKGRVCVKS
jgi:hypothetical protein